MKTIYDVVKVKKQWHVCKLTPESNERWIITSEGYKTRAGAFTEMHSQRFTDREAVLLKI
uniref:DUF1508 domain-containing protein n=1 Tax=viral metagenome TaxID=1070528 RepID=A0A6M3IZA4_9ZZZZ